MTNTYKITVEITREEEVLTSGKYINEEDRDAEMIADGRSYSKAFPELKQVAREIYSQVTDDLDLAAVIMAVNPECKEA